GPELAVALDLLDRRAEVAQRFDHERGIARMQGPAQKRRLTSEGGEHELPVREALGSGELEPGIPSSACRRSEPRARLVGDDKLVIAVWAELWTGIPVDLHRLPEYRANRPTGGDSWMLAQVLEPRAAELSDLDWSLMSTETPETGDPQGAEAQDAAP